MQTFLDTLTASAVELGIECRDFRLLDDGETETVIREVKEAFGDAANGAMLWWHSDLLCPKPNTREVFQSGDGWKYLARVASTEKAPVWYHVENADRNRPQSYVFSSRADVVQSILGNMHYFEYIVCGHNFDWLFAEDHHDCVMVAGAEAVSRFKKQAVNMCAK